MNTVIALPTGFGLLALMLCLLGAVFLVVALVRIRRLRLLSAGGHCLCGAALLAVGVALIALGANIHTYQRLTAERPVAEVEFTQTGPRQFDVRLHFSDIGQYRDVSLSGDEWQLDARVLKWAGLAILAGADTQYRLERISGRYRDIDSELEGPRSVHALAENPGLDLWRLAQDYERYMPWIDARYGSATYLPMRHGARFEVAMTQTGLIARPLNAAGESAVREWR